MDVAGVRAVVAQALRCGSGSATAQERAEWSRVAHQAANAATPPRVFATAIDEDIKSHLIGKASVLKQGGGSHAELLAHVVDVWEEYAQVLAHLAVAFASLDAELATECTLVHRSSLPVPGISAARTAEVHKSLILERPSEKMDGPCSKLATVLAAAVPTADVSTSSVAQRGLVLWVEVFMASVHDSVCEALTNFLWEDVSAKVYAEALAQEGGEKSPFNLPAIAAKVVKMIRFVSQYERRPMRLYTVTVDAAVQSRVRSYYSNLYNELFGLVTRQGESVAGEQGSEKNLFGALVSERPAQDTASTSRVRCVADAGGSVANRPGGTSAQRAQGAATEMPPAPSRSLASDTLQPTMSRSSPRGAGENRTEFPSNQEQQCFVRSESLEHTKPEAQEKQIHAAASPNDRSRDPAQYGNALRHPSPNLKDVSALERQLAQVALSPAPRASGDVLFFSRSIRRSLVDAFNSLWHNFAPATAVRCHSLLTASLPKNIFDFLLESFVQSARDEESDSACEIATLVLLLEGGRAALLSSLHSSAEAKARTHLRGALEGKAGGRELLSRLNSLLAWVASFSKALGTSLAEAEREISSFVPKQMFSRGMVELRARDRASSPAEQSADISAISTELQRGFQRVTVLLPQLSRALAEYADSLLVSANMSGGYDEGHRSAVPSGGSVSDAGATSPAGERHAGGAPPRCNLQSVLSIFAICRGKEEFMLEMQRRFAARVLEEPSRVDAEQEFVAAFEAACGSAFVAQYSRMVADVRRSISLKEQLHVKCSGGAPAALRTIRPLILTHGSWPMPFCRKRSAKQRGAEDGHSPARSSEDSPAPASPGAARDSLPYDRDCRPAKEFADAVYAFLPLAAPSSSRFHSFRWRFTSSLCVADYIQGSYAVQVSVPVSHISVAMLLLKGRRRTDEVAQVLEMSPTLTERLMRELQAAGLCASEGNDGRWRIVLPADIMRSGRREIKIAEWSGAEEDERSEHDGGALATSAAGRESDSLRLLQQARVVSIMKQQFRLSHNELYRALCERYPALTPSSEPAFKELIEKLIERDYIERDDNDRTIYQYVP